MKAASNVRGLGHWTTRQWPWLCVGAAWAATIAASTGGLGYVFDHQALIESTRLSWPIAALAFLLSWQLMTVAMMLPSSMPLLDFFRQANQANHGGWTATLAFLAGYAAVWTAFAGMAFGGDTLVHHLVDTSPWLAAHPWLIVGTTLVVAGAFQFTPLKERCLTQCRSPLAFFIRYYRRGAGGAWQLGLRHGKFCLGCCWALMLLMFGLGVGSILWMVNIAAVMLLERTARLGHRFVPIFGAVLLLWGALVLAQPGWLPPALARAALLR